MAFDEENHEIHPETGFVVHKETGHPVGLLPRPVAKSTLDPEYPKWVTPHAGHVVRQVGDGVPDHVSTPAWPLMHLNRVDGAVTVMVHNADEEDRAIAAPVAAEVTPVELEHHPV